MVYKNNKTRIYQENNSRGNGILLAEFTIILAGERTKATKTWKEIKKKMQERITVNHSYRVCGNFESCTTAQGLFDSLHILWVVAKRC